MDQKMSRVSLNVPDLFAEPLLAIINNATWNERPTYTSDVCCIHEKQDFKLNHYTLLCLKIELKDKNRNFGTMLKSAIHQTKLTGLDDEVDT